MIYLTKNYDIDASNYIDAILNQNPSESEISAVNLITKWLKESNLYNKIKACWLISQASLEATKYNLINPAKHKITWFNNPGFSANGVLGILANGTYGDTNYNSTTEGDLITDLGLTIYTGNDVTTGVSIGCITASATVTLAPNIAGTTYGTISSLTTAVFGDEFGTITVNDNGTFQQMLKNGVGVAQANSGASLIGNINYYLLAVNNNALPTNLLDGTLKTAMIHEYLTPVESTLLHNIIHQFNKSLNRSELV